MQPRGIITRRLLLPAVVLFGLVSSQTAINEHFRYVLPSFGFAFVLCGVLATAGVPDAPAGRRPAADVSMKEPARPFLPRGRLSQAAGRALRVTAAACLLWTSAAAFGNHPHHLAYFNELAGGPKDGWKHLLGSSLDWGQDLLLLENWLCDNKERWRVSEFVLPWPRELVELTPFSQGPGSAVYITSVTALCRNGVVSSNYPLSGPLRTCDEAGHLSRVVGRPGSGTLFVLKLTPSPSEPAFLPEPGCPGDRPASVH